ncbi:MAG: gliding motility-associated C-terminal domain-containing protein [Bacteroidia bacterium]|nr:gliding motility-associated C-terminal domain-containing protein [Bacteroidia bacterium]
MRTNLFFWIFAFALVYNTSFCQQLVINEVSQGPSGSKEYVELLVIGTPTCSAIPCMDLRDHIIDDNNGNHATGGGTGIASGCVRLKNIPFWSCIPIGTMILIYNDADQNALIPAIDLSMADGNCKLVIPISDCTLLERHTSIPSTAVSTYPSTGYTNCGNWGPISMANSDDSFQTIDASGTLLHSVSWGNNNLSTIIYFAGGAGGNVAIMNNSVDNNPANQLNWTMVGVAGNETPGFANNAANNNWINSMNNACSPLLSFTATAFSSNSGCICNGSATINVTGGIGPYTYTWFPSGGNASAASNLCGGTYTVSSQSSNGCLQTKTVNIATVSSLTLTINNNSITCNGLSNGSATINAIGGTLPYSYTWSPLGGNASSASGLPVGIYTVTVKDANNCISTATTTITQPTAALSAIVSSTNNLCFGASGGVANVSPNGGTPAYSFTWSPLGGNAATANGLAAGIVSVTVKDANNCTFNSTVSITQPTAGITTAISSTNILCFGGANGAASVTPNGGTPAFSYTWIPAGGNSSMASGLSAGTYTVLIKDLNNCTYSSTTSITQPPSGIIAAVSSTNVLCFGGANGAASVLPNGGTPAYSYTWSPSGGNSSLANGLTAGNYTVFIKDANNCNATSSVLIGQPQQFGLSVNSITLCNNQPGILSATIAGGASPITYNWNGSSSPSNTISVTATTTSIYTVSATDANGCVSNIQNASVNIASFLNLSVSPNASVCSGAMATMSAGVSGGSGNYNYVWQPGSLIGPVQNVSVSGSQIYTVSVADGCSSAISKTISIASYPIPASNIISSQNSGCFPLCVTFSNATLFSSGLVQSYQWNFGNTNVSNLSSPKNCYTQAGNYSVTINYITINGCVGSQTLSNSIQIYPTPVAQFVADKTEIGSYGTVINFTNQSTNATNYSWYFGDGITLYETNPSFTFLTEQDQYVYLTAKNDFGCTNMYMLKIDYKPEFTFFAPNTFTPNDDNLNDIFLPKGTGWNTDKFELTVYDRWGEKIFGTKHYNEGWNGNVRGSESSVQSDVYVWKVSLTDVFSKHHEFVGHIFIEK